MKMIIFRNFSKVSLALICLLSANTLFAQELKIVPTSRLLLDGATYSEKEVELTDGFILRDFRMGLKAYYGEFYLKADASFSNNKVSLKDIYVQYNVSDHSLVRGGHFSVPYGLQSAYGTAHKQFMAEPSSNVYQMGRRIGLMHSVWNDKVWLSYGAFADNKALTEGTNVTGKQGYTVSERFVYKPICSDGQLIQAGFSFAHIQAEATTKDAIPTISYKTGYLTAVDKTNAINAVVDHARYENKWTAELAGIYKSFAIESQYYSSNIKRKDLPSFKSDGFYVVAKGMILNRSNYKYQKDVAGIGTPSNKTLELAVGYSMLNMNSNKAEIYGGKMDDISAGLAFYWNKYVTIRTNYSYITVKTTDEAPKAKVNAFQCRVQYYF